MKARSLAFLSLSLIAARAGMAEDPAPRPAVALAEMSLNIAAQPMPGALAALAEQTGVQLIFPSTEVPKNLDAPAIKGSYTPRTALRMLLADSGLKDEWISDRLVAIRAAATSSAPPTGVNEEGRGAPFLLAQTDPNALRAAPSSATNEGRGEREVTELDEIIITGSHIRGEQSPPGSHIILIGREEIEQSGRGTVQDLLETLPQTFTGISEDFSQSRAGNLNRGAEIQLRGIGAGTTLTLINGHRQAGGGTQAAFVDISAIPTAAIERVELLPDGASAIYGSDAIGGVVNIILRKDFEGAETRARLSDALGDARETQLAQLVGTRWDTGGAMIGYQYYDRDALLYGDRPYNRLERRSAPVWRQRPAARSDARPGHEPGQHPLPHGLADVHGGPTGVCHSNRAGWHRSRGGRPACRHGQL